MKRSVLLIAMIMLLTTIHFGTASDVQQPADIDDLRSIEIPYTFIAPELDGRIGAVEWNAEFAMHYYDAFDGESLREIYPESGSDEEFTNQSELAVTFYLLYDDIFLYFAANVTDDNIVVDSGPSYWRDDGIELLIDGAHDMDEDQRADDPWPGFEDGTTLLATADGSTYHDYSSGTPFERSLGSDWYCVARVAPDDSYYIVEMKVRLDSISSPSVNSTIGLNIGVNDDDNGGLSKTALKWEGREVESYENPTFKNESLWGSARLLPYVNASLPDRLYVDEDTPVEISSNGSFGNHPDFGSDAIYDWTIPLRNNDLWNNHTYSGDILTFTFDDPTILYSVHLTVTDPAGISDDTVTYVHVADITPPVVNSEDGLALEETAFTFFLNVSDNVEISNITWSLFDGEWYNTTTIAPTFLHTFDHPGIYTLHYIVTDTSGNEVQGSVSIEVLDDRPPVVPDMPNIEMNTSSPYAADASGSYDDTPGDPYSTDLLFNWTLSNEYRSFRYQGAEVNIIITVPGIYNGTLTVTDQNNLSSVREFLVLVEDTTPPVVDIIIPNILDEGKVYSLEPFATNDNDPDLWDGASVNWTVEQPDNSFRLTSSRRELNITFPGPGMATITLKVTDPGGNFGMITRTVEVRDATAPELVIDIPSTVDEGEIFLLNLSRSSDNAGIVSLHYSISSNISGNITEVLSTPPFGIRVRNMDPSDFHTLDDLELVISTPGEYLISVWIMDVTNLTTYRNVSLTVLDATPPDAILNRSYAAVIVGELLLLSGSQSSDEYGPLTFKWMLDGEPFQEKGPEFGYIFSSAGIHNITLTVFDARGNSATASCYVEVIEEATTSGEGESNTSLLIWAFTISIILLGTLFLFLWARSRRNDYMSSIREE